jgi:hypothetical protein
MCTALTDLNNTREPLLSHKFVARISHLAPRLRILLGHVPASMPIRPNLRSLESVHLTLNNVEPKF